MARQWRIEYEGALYHVMSRGNEGRSIAGDDEDRELFMSLLGDMSDRFEIEVHWEGCTGRDALGGMQGHILISA